MRYKIKNVFCFIFVKHIILYIKSKGYKRTKDNKWIRLI